MNKKTIYITQYDMDRLRELLEKERYVNIDERGYLKNLKAELDRSTVVNQEEIPPTVITMNSKVELVDLDTGETLTYTLVFPKDADLQANKISVLAPIGTAMLGYSVGDIFEWEVPAGLTRLKVQNVLYQPEASGEYDL